jgi:hypothetical protein
LFLGHDDKFPPLFAPRKLPRRLHDVENENFVFINEFPEVMSKARYGLSREGLSSLGKDNGNIDATVERPRDDANERPRLAGLYFAEEHAGLIATRRCILKLLYDAVNARRQSLIIFARVPESSVKPSRHFAIPITPVTLPETFSPAHLNRAHRA